MGYKIDIKSLNNLFDKLRQEYVIYAPKVFKGEGTYSDTDRIRYGEIAKIEEVVFDQKSEFSYKEILTPISDTLFYFTENQIKEADAPIKGAIVFLRSCDLHAVKRMDDIYLKNGFEDYYYKRLREKTKFILMGCSQSFDSCFCVDMETNQTSCYDAYIKVEGETAYIDNACDHIEALLGEIEKETLVVTPDFVMENKTKVNIPDNLSPKVRDSKMWEEYHARCIGCGRCNFVCPTCTCFTMQDIFYTDNGKAGERRRVCALRYSIRYMIIRADLVITCV